MPVFITLWDYIGAGAKNDMAEREGFEPIFCTTKNDLLSMFFGRPTKDS